MGNFKYDLQVGQTAERLVSDRFIEKGYTVEFNTGSTITELSGWDLCITKDDKVYKIEVKNDLMCIKTGNVAIEHKCINNSTADILVYVIKDKGIFYTTINNGRYMLTDKIDGRNLWGGDGGRSYMKLVRYEEFIKYCWEL